MTETIALPHSTNPSKQLPLLGLGCWQAAPGKVEQAVETALKSGYRLIDSAAIYQNEKEVGEGIKRAGIPREEIWVTSKLWNNSHRPELVEKALDKTLSDLGLDYLDLYLIHWPVAFKAGGELIPKENGVAVIDKGVTIAETWAALEALLSTGKVKNIGISNFTRSETEELLKTAKIKPAVNQLEIHPYLAQLEYTKWLQDQGIAITAYSPFGNLNPIYETGKDVRIIDTDVVKKIAARTGHTPTQVVLSWGIAHKFSVIPKSENPERIVENLKVFKLDEADVKAIDTLDHGKRYNDPSTLFGKVFFADEKSTFTSAAQAATNAATNAVSAAKNAVGA